MKVIIGLVVIQLVVLAGCEWKERELRQYETLEAVELTSADRMHEAFINDYMTFDHNKQY